jgi:hypothetical protein
MTYTIDLNNPCGESTDDECKHLGTDKCAECLRTAIHDLVDGNDPVQDFHEKESWTGLKYIDTREDAFGNEIEYFKCSCGRTHSVLSGGDIACCPCEFENEDNTDEVMQNL